MNKRKSKKKHGKNSTNMKLLENRSTNKKNMQKWEGTYKIRKWYN